MKGQAKIDEFAFVLLAGIVLIVVLMMWTIPTEPTPLVEPSSFSLTMLAGSSRQIELNISTPGNPITNVSISASGDIIRWVTFSQSYFDYISGYKIVKVNIAVPANAAIKTYKGNIKVSSVGGSKVVPIEINVQNISAITFLSRVLPVDDFYVSFTSGSKIVDAVSNVEVSKGYFSEDSLNLVGVLEDTELNNVVDGYIRLVITDTNKLGVLKVDLNGHEVYNRPTDLGEVIIPINVSMLARSNVVKIKAGNPGWMFWARNVYKIRDASFVVYFRGSITKEILVNLTSQEVSGFNHMKLNSIIRYDKKPILRIKVNEQTVFWGEPPISILNLWIDKDILGNKLSLVTGTNKIFISTEAPSQVNFINTVITFNYLP